MLQDFCQPIDTTSWKRNIPIRIASKYDEKELSFADAFLLGYCEDRNSDNQGADADSTEAIRKELYILQDLPKQFTIIDLGDCKLGDSVAESYTNLEHCLAELVQYNKPIIIFGGTQEATRYMTKSSFRDILYPALTFIDSRIDLDIDFEDFSNKNYVATIYAEYPYARLIHLANQGYLTAKKSLDWWDANYFPKKRLGECNTSPLLAEPFIRDAQLISFDISAIRYSDSPAGKNVNGLYAETACQYAWYAGFSSRMNTFFLNEYNLKQDTDLISAKLAAQILWHVFNGISDRKTESYDFNDSSYAQIYLKHEDLDRFISFYESQLSQAMWVEVPIGSTGKSRIIPCSKANYEEFHSGKIEENWMLEYKRLINIHRKKFNR